jgi:hypothetical protein
MKPEKNVSRRELERVLGAGVPQTVGQLAHNDKVTQQRVQALEKKLDETIDAATDCDRLMAKRIDSHQAWLDAFRRMSFTQRLRWFLRGEQ